MRISAIASLVALQMALPSSASSQTPVQVGARIRITSDSPGGPRQSGRLTQVGPDTLVLDSRPFLRASITQLELSEGSKSHWLLGMGIGFVAGAITGTIIGNNICADATEWSAESCAVAGGALLGAGGLALGALIGAAFRSERWKRVSLADVRIGLSPSGAGSARVALSVWF